jgi:hypothetical protein
VTAFAEGGLVCGPALAETTLDGCIIPVARPASPDEAVTHAIANARLSGVELHPDWIERLRDLVHGRTSIDALLREATGPTKGKTND